MLKPTSYFMARYASEAKGGFYPTPKKQSKLICQRLEVCPDLTRAYLKHYNSEVSAETVLDKKTINILDPYAGEGIIVNEIRDTLRNQSYNAISLANELEENRFNECKKRCDRALHGGYEYLSMDFNKIAVLYNNPPYATHHGQRLEYVFTRNMTARAGRKQFLQDYGLCISVVPQHTLQDLSLILSSRFDPVLLYRFTDDDYDLYQQVVVAGNRLPPNARFTPERRRLKGYLEWVATAGSGILPPLDYDDGIKFKLPLSAGIIEKFRGERIDPKEIATFVDKSPLFEKVENMLLPPAIRKRVEIQPPILPLNVMQYGTVAAAGISLNMGGYIQTGDTVKVKDGQLLEGDDGETLTLTTERHVTSLNVFANSSAKGVFVLE